MNANRCEAANSLIACQTVVLLSYIVNETEARHIRVNRVGEIYHRGPRGRVPRRTGKIGPIEPGAAIGPGLPGRNPRTLC